MCRIKKKERKREIDKGKEKGKRDRGETVREREGTERGGETVFMFFISVNQKKNRKTTRYILCSLLCPVSY